MKTIPGAEVTVGIEWDDNKKRVVFRLDGRPEFSVQGGELSKLLSRTCVSVPGRRERGE